MATTQFYQSTASLSPQEADIAQHIHAFAEDFFRNPKFDASHDFDHVKRVTHNAVHILNLEQARRHDASLPGLNPLTIILGALLHDVEDRKYADSFKDVVPPIRSVLLEQGLSEDYAQAVLELVEGVSYSSEVKNPARVQRLLQDLPELAVVQDADRLDAIGAIGIGRCFTFGGAKSIRSLHDSIDHFHDKLLKLESMMKTEAGRQMAAERSRRIREFVSWWQDENALV